MTPLLSNTKVRERVSQVLNEGHGHKQENEAVGGVPTPPAICVTGLENRLNTFL